MSTRVYLLRASISLCLLRMRTRMTLTLGPAVAIEGRRDHGFFTEERRLCTSPTAKTALVGSAAATDGPRSLKLSSSRAERCREAADRPRTPGVLHRHGRYSVWLEIRFSDQKQTCTRSKTITTEPKSVKPVYVAKIWGLTIHGIIVYSIPARERYTRKNRKVSPPPPQKHTKMTHMNTKHSEHHKTQHGLGPGCPALRTGAVG